MMRIVLRNLEDGSIYRDAGWTRRISEAAVFNDRDTACRKAQEIGLPNLELLFISPDGTPVMGMPVRDAGGRKSVGE